MNINNICGPEQIYFADAKFVQVFEIFLNHYLGDPWFLREKAIVLPPEGSLRQSQSQSYIPERIVYTKMTPLHGTYVATMQG